MARKKKRPSRKELKQQRQEIVARKRVERGWQSHRTGVEAGLDNELLLDMLPLFPLLEEGPPTLAMAEEFMANILDTADLAEEAEFDEIIVNPLQYMEMLAKIEEESGVEPEDLTKLSDEEQEERQLDLLEKVIERLLTSELRQDIIERLDQLRRRLKRLGEPEEAARAAILQIILREDGQNREVWPMIGLIQAIFQRSLVAGLTIYEASSEAMEKITSETPGDIPSPLELLRAESVEFDEKLKNVPGLVEYLSKQTDKIWADGMKALQAGELRLELFSEEEIETGMAIFEDAFVVDDAAGKAGEEGNLEAGELMINSETGQIFRSQMTDYLEELLTPERFEQIQMQFETLLQEENYPDKWRGFILLLADYIANEDPTDYDHSLLNSLFISELLTSSWFIKEPTSEEIAPEVESLQPSG